jgi:endoglucanase
MNKNFLELLEKMCLTFAPTGCENRMAELIEEAVGGVADCKKDRLGNLIVHLKGNGKKIMLSAGMDEAGFMITDVDDKGYVRLDKTGGGDTGCFLGQRILLGNEQETLTGVGGAKVLHLASGAESSDTPAIDKLFVDTGLTKDEVSAKIEKGDFAAYEGTFRTLPSGYIAGKALESRCACAILVSLILTLASKKEEERNDLYFVFGIKEKAGMSGAVVASYAIDPEEAYLVSYAPANDFEGVDEEKKGAKLGSGAVVALKDRRVLYFDAPLMQKALDTAKEQNIPAVALDQAQADLSSGALHLVRAGIPCASIRVPCRNPETTLAIMKTEDIDSVYALLLALI